MVPSHVLRERTEAHRKALEASEARIKAMEGTAKDRDEALRLTMQYLESLETPGGPEAGAQGAPAEDPLIALRRELGQAFGSMEQRFVAERDAIARRESRSMLMQKYPHIAGNENLMKMVGRIAARGFHGAEDIEGRIAAVLDAAEQVDTAIKLGRERAFDKAAENKAAAVETGERPVVKAQMPDLPKNATPAQIKAFLKTGFRAHMGSPPEE